MLGLKHNKFFECAISMIYAYLIFHNNASERANTHTHTGADTARIMGKDNESNYT